MRLVAEELAGERGGEPIFEGIAFTLEAGEALLVTGPNGAGKSTLLRVIAGLLPSFAGAARIEHATQHFPDVAAASHYLGHLNAMKPALSVAENLGFWRRFNGEPRLEVEEALDEIGLPDVGHLPFAYLSTGQKRRISIARLLVSHRPVWLLDEPTAGLDRRSETWFADLMRKHLRDAGILIAATHLPLGLEGAKELRMGEANG